jgi:hypothetical protein
MSRGLSVQQKKILGLAYSVNKLCNGGEFVLDDGEVVPAHQEFNPPLLGDRFKDGRYWTIETHGLSYTIDALVSEKLPDINPRAARHYIYGTPICDKYITKSNGVVTPPTGAFESTKESRVAKASAIRAIGSLEKSGYLILVPGKERSLMRKWALSDALKEFTQMIVEKYPRESDFEMGFKNELGSFRHKSGFNVADVWGYSLTEKGARIGVDFQIDVDAVTLAQLFFSKSKEFIRADHEKKDYQGIIDAIQLTNKNE